MQYPEIIKFGDTIGVTATSAGNGDELHIRKLESAIQAFQDRGYKIKETTDVRTDTLGRSAPKQERAKQFMELISNPEIKAIITARGGEFLVEILPFLDFETMKKHPKWVQGYSDTTGVTFCITTICDIATIYGENFSTFGMRPWHESLERNLKLLEGEKIVQHSFEAYQDGWQEEITGLEPYCLTQKVEWKNARQEKEMIMHGRLLGGCLDVLLCLVGTKYDNVKSFCKTYCQDGIIWFLDNCERTSEEILRGLWQLKEAGWFSFAKGMIFGRSMTKSSHMGIPFEQAVLDAVGDLSIPIIFEADIGHVAPQMTLINGAMVHITSKDGKGTMFFEKK